MFSSLITKVTKPFTNNGQVTQDPPSRQRDRVEDGFLLVGDTASERTTVRASHFAGNQVDCPPSYGDVAGRDALPSYSDYTASVDKYSPLTDSVCYSGFAYDSPLRTGAPTIQTGTSNYGHGNQYGIPTSTVSPTIQTGACNFNHGNPYGDPAAAMSPTVQVPTNQFQGDSNLNIQNSSQTHSNKSAISDVPFVVGCDISLVSTLRDIRSSNILQQETFNVCNYEYDFDIENNFLREHGPSRDNEMEVQYYDNMCSGN